MAIIDDSGGAFPIHGMDGPIDDGMSLRDYFAGQALISHLISSYSRVDEKQAGVLIARDCYALADAMLAERRKTR